MPFNSTVTTSINPVTEGELGDGPNIVLSTIDWSAPLNIGRFAQLLTVGSVPNTLTNMDGTGTPNIAGVVLRSPVDLLELPGQAGAPANILVSEKNQNYVRQGLVTVRLSAASGIPAKFSTVYAVNSEGSIDNGNAQDTAGSGDTAAVAVNAEFVEQVQPGIWLVRLK